MNMGQKYTLYLKNQCPTEDIFSHPLLMIVCPLGLTAVNSWQSRSDPVWNNVLEHPFLLYFIIFWPCHTACGILVPWPGVEPLPPAVEAWSPNHWTTREAPRTSLLLLPDLLFICPSSTYHSNYYLEVLFWGRISFWGSMSFKIPWLKLPNLLIVHWIL